jgi:hypothetical protein
MLPLHALAVGSGNSMAISQLTLADKGPPAEFAMAFCPGALAVLLEGEHKRKCRRAKKTPGKLSYLDVMGG